MQKQPEAVSPPFETRGFQWLSDESHVLIKKYKKECVISAVPFVLKFRILPANNPIILNTGYNRQSNIPAYVMFSLRSWFPRGPLSQRRSKRCQRTT